MLFVRTDTQPPNLRLRIQEALDHVKRYGSLEGETKRQAVCHLAGLSPMEEDFADRNGLLPADPV